jgi:phosphatidylglycerol:prolipoprotein diacylglycerol transferase
MFPILAYIGDFALKSYYVINIIGVIAGFIVLSLNIKNLAKGTKRKTLFFAAFIFIPFITGARLGNTLDSLINHTPICASRYLIWGPVSLWWGLVLATVLAFPIAKMFETDVWETADLFAPSIAIGGVFARLACLSEGCCFGLPCPDTIPGALFTSISPAYAQFPGKLLYPTQIYESFSWLVIFVVLILYRNHRTFRGELIITLAALYSAARFSIEFVRFHEKPAFLSVAQIWSIVIFATSLFLYFYFKKHGINKIKQTGKSI